MSRENVEVARKALEAFVGGGVDAAVPFFDSAITWEMAEDESDATTYRGHDGVRTMVARWLEAFDRLRVEPHEYIDAGEWVVIPYTLSARGRSTGLEVAGTETWVFQIRGGKVIGVREYREKAEALEAVGLSD